MDNIESNLLVQLDQGPGIGQMQSYWIFCDICKVKYATAWKLSDYGVFSGPYFPVFGLNTERYEVSLRIQSECGKIRTRKNSVSGHFSRSMLHDKLFKINSNISK